MVNFELRNYNVIQQVVIGTRRAIEEIDDRVVASIMRNIATSADVVKR